MIVSTILLTREDVYVGSKGELPHGRPDFDKELLTTLCKGQVVSLSAYEMLPPSIRRIVDVTDQIEPTIGITIPEINGLTDLLIVVRASGHTKGAKFRFDNFEPIVIQRVI